MSVVFNKSRGASIYSQKFNYQLENHGRASSLLNKAIKSEIAMENFNNYVDELLANESDDVLFKKKLIGYVNEKIDKTVDDEYAVAFMENIDQIGHAFSSGDFKRSGTRMAERNNMALIFTHINTAIGTSTGLSGEEFYNLVGALRKREVSENGSVTYSARTADEIKEMVGDATLDKIVASIAKATPQQAITKDQLIEYLTEISDNLHKQDTNFKINVGSFYTLVDDIHARIARANPISIDNAVRVSEEIIKKTMDRLNKEVPNLAKELTFEDTQVLFLNRSVITDPHLKKLKRFSPKVNEIISEAVKELNITGAIKAPMNFNGTVMSLARANTMVINNSKKNEPYLSSLIKNPELYNNELFLNDILSDFTKDSCFIYKTEDLCKTITDNIELSKNYQDIHKPSGLISGPLQEASMIARDKVKIRANKNFITQKEETAKNMEQIVSQIDKDNLPLVLTKGGKQAFKTPHIFRKLFIAAMDKMIADFGERNSAKRIKEAERIYSKLIRGKDCGLDKKLTMQDISNAASAFDGAALIAKTNYAMFAPSRNSNFFDDSNNFNALFNKAIVDVAKKMGFVQNIIPIALLGDNVSESEFQDFKYQRMLKPTMFFAGRPDFEPVTEHEHITNILFNTKMVTTKPIFHDGFTNDQKLELLKTISPYLIKLSSMMGKKESNIAPKDFRDIKSEIAKFPDVIQKSSIAKDFDVNDNLKDRLTKKFETKNFGFNELIGTLNLKNPDAKYVVLIGAIMNELAKDVSFLKHYYEKEIKDNERGYTEFKKSALESLIFNKIRLAEVKAPKYDEVFAARNVLQRECLDGKSLKQSDFITQEGKDKIAHISGLFTRQRFFRKNKDIVKGATLVDKHEGYLKALKKITQQNLDIKEPYDIGKMTNKFLENEKRVEKLVKEQEREKIEHKNSGQKLSTQEADSDIKFDL